MINSNSINFRFYKIIESEDLLEHGKYQAYDTPYNAPEFNWGQPFFTQEELVERICTDSEEKAFKEKVKNSPEIVINDKGCVVRLKKSGRADGLRKFLGEE